MPFLFPVLLILSLIFVAPSSLMGAPDTASHEEVITDTTAADTEEILEEEEVEPECD